MKFLFTVFTIMFVSSLFILSAHAIETSVADEVSATKTNERTKSTESTGINDKSSVSVKPYRSDSRDHMMMKNRKIQFSDAKDHHHGPLSNSSGEPEKR